MKKIIIGIFVFTLILFSNITLINAEESLDNNNNQNEVNLIKSPSTTNLENLNLAIDNANQLLNGITYVFEDNSFNSFKQTFNDTKDFVDNNEEIINQNQDKVDELTNNLNNVMENIKVKEQIINKIQNKITEGNELLNSNTSNYDEDDLVLLQNMVSEANQFINDYNSNGIVVFLPNNKTIGQVAEEVIGEANRLTTKIQNAIDRLNLKKLELPDLSEYEGQSIREGLNSVGEDGSYSARDILYAKIGYSDVFWGNASQNIAMLNYLKGAAANITDLKQAAEKAKQITNNNANYEQNSYSTFQQALNKATKFLNKWQKLGVNVLPTDQEKVDTFTNNLLEAITNLKIKENITSDNKVNNNQTSQTSKSTKTTVNIIKLNNNNTVQNNTITQNDNSIVENNYDLSNEKTTYGIKKSDKKDINKEVETNNYLWLLLGLLVIISLIIILVIKSRKKE